MAEKLIPINPPPGVFRNGTKYQARGRWYDANLVRWQDGAIMPIGGWGTVKTAAGVVVDLLGFPRGALAWRRSDGAVWLAAGTTGTATTRLYAISNGVLSNVTPAGMTDGSANGTNAGGAGQYGSGPYGFGPYGIGSSLQTLVDADTWSLDNYGDTLVAVMTGDGKMYKQSTTAIGTQIPGSPTGVRALVVTAERFLFALGKTGDIARVTWATQESGLTDAADWTPSATNTAGDYPLTTTGRLIAGRRTTRETLLWTDTDLHAATFVGTPYVYAFEQRGDNCGLYGPNAVATVGSKAYWMGEREFFVYDGSVRNVPCDVSDFVFPSLNRSQRAKVFAIPIPEFQEIMWFYPTDGAENSRYVAYNWEHGFWMIGQLPRAAGYPGGALRYPVMFGTDGIMYDHELGSARGSEVPYLESGPIEIAVGDNFMDVQTLIPDENTLGDVSATFYTTFYPTDLETTVGPYSLAAPTDVRFTARHARVRLEEVVQGSWRVGVFRFGAVLGERR